MNMKLKLLIIPFALSAGLLAQAPPPGPPQEFPHLRGGRIGQRAGFMARQLNLSDDQKAAMKAIGLKHKDEMKAKHQAQLEARKAFQALMGDLNAKTSDIQAAHQVLSQRSLEVALAGRAFRTEMRAVLTPDQQIQADKLREEGKARHQRRMMHLRKGLGLEH
jgi:Spy/CpxP family protein refolding chaperone